MTKISSFSLPNINYFGPNSSQKVSDMVKKIKTKKALIVTDIDLPATGIPDIIKYNVEEANIYTGIWAGIHPNPSDIDVKNGIEAFRETDYDTIIAVGGGSAIDCAKGIRVVLDNGGEIKDYEGTNKIPLRKTPLIAIATTAGTSSEANKIAVITNSENEEIKYKMGFIDSYLLPDASINDPLLTVSLNPFYTAGTGMDAFTHAVEAIMSTEATTFSDAMGYNAINLITKWLKIAVEEGNNIEARTNMMQAVLFAGVAFNTALLGITHSLAHPIGTYYDIHHGMCNAIILPAVCRFNLSESQEKLALIAEAMRINTSKMSTIEAANKAIEGIEHLLQDVKAPTKLGELGVDKSKIERMSIDAYNDFCAGTSPKKATIDDFRRLYESII
jgi:alcohol dehydrogenase